MDATTFIELAKQYFERVGKLESPGGRKLWGIVIDGFPDAEVAKLLEEYAFKGDRFPSPKAFAEELAWRCRAGVDMPQPIETDDGAELCAVCQEPVHWFMQGGQKIRMRGSGGVLYREHEGAWYIARCYECRGPDWAHRLPFPHPMHRPHWKAWTASEVPVYRLRLDAEAA